MTDSLNYTKSKNVVGVILAGGQSRRFGGGDKFLKKLNGKLLIDHVIDRVSPQTSNVIINSNSNADLFKGQNHPIIPDSIGGYAGPLAGILTGMEWVLRVKPQCKWIVTFPSDAPFIPLDSAEKMIKCAEEERANIVCSASNGRTHPVCALWQVGLADDLRKAMINEEIRKIDLWTARYRSSVVEFSDQPFDPFFNINKPGDLERAEEILKSNEI
jgi:molybdenum cofactor guanylyltransferase